MENISWGNISENCQPILEKAFSRNTITYNGQKVSDKTIQLSLEIIARDAISSILNIFVCHSKYKDERIATELSRLLDRISNGLTDIDYKLNEDTEFLSISSYRHIINLERQNHDIWWCNSLKVISARDYAAPIEILKGSHNKFTYFSSNIDPEIICINPRI